MKPKMVDCQLPFETIIITYYTKEPVKELIDWYRFNQLLWTVESFSEFEPHLIFAEQFYYNELSATFNDVKSEFDKLQSAARSLLQWNFDLDDNSSNNSGNSWLDENLLLIYTGGLLAVLSLILFMRFLANRKTK